jgi:hypothetical protein
MRKGGHRYRSEAAISATNETMSHITHKSMDKKDANTRAFCWLDTNPLAIDHTSKPRNIIPKWNDTSTHLTPVCPDPFQRSMAPQIRSKQGLTIGLPYYAAPALLLMQVANFASFPVEIQEQLTVIVVDDGSPPGLHALDYLSDTILGRRANHTSIPSFHFHLKIARITTEIDWNIEGSRNLAFYLADTQLGLMLDLDMLLPLETVKEVLNWRVIKIDNQTNMQFHVAHKFNRKKPDGKQSIQPALGVLDIQEYWNAGGLDEDFAGSYGHGTEPHFWHLWANGDRKVEKHLDTYLLELSIDACDATLLKFSDKIELCTNSKSKMQSLVKDRSRNKKLWKKKRSGKVPWSNSYLRFNWTIDLWDK